MRKLLKIFELALILARSRLERDGDQKESHLGGGGMSHTVPEDVNSVGVVLGIVIL